jgi:predicted 3-demethylubiquinone-9 3-methyltransferase (glyoxalase superfamily)
MRSSIVVFLTVSLVICLLWLPKSTGDENQLQTQKVAKKTKITPFLMFEGKAEEAMNFYVGLFPDAKIVTVQRYRKEGPGKEGTIEQAVFEIAGQRFNCIDSPAKHAFTFTPSISLFVDCTSESQIEELSKKLSENGTALMPLGKYGFSRRFAWIQDRFGVSWQLSLPND